MRRIASLLVVFLVLGFSFGVLAAPAAINLDTNIPPSDAPDMIGGTPVQERFSELDDPFVLLVQDMASFWGNSNQQVLDQLGLDYDIMHSASLAGADLSDYTFVIIEGNQDATFNQNVLNNMAVLQDYVDTGGWLQFHFATNTHTPAMVLWDGTGYVYLDNDVNNWEGPDGAGHPILDGVTEPYPGNSANHGYLTGYPGGAAVIVVTTAGNPTLIEYGYGEGNVVASTMTLEFLWTYYQATSGQILLNMMTYMGDNGPQAPVTLTLTPTLTDVPYNGGPVVYNAHLVSTIGLSMSGLRYQTFATLPNNTVYGPIDNIPFNLTPFMNATVNNLHITVPANAPAGNYMFEGRAGVPNNPNQQVTDSFPFVKHNMPGTGLDEDFNDGLAQDFTWFIGAGSYTIDGGYLKANASGADWFSGTYTLINFDNFILESHVMIQDAVGNSRGLLWCANGPYDADLNGYSLFFSNGYYSVWRWAASVPTLITGWNANGSINQGIGEINDMEVDGNAGTYDLYINGTYLFSFFDVTYTSGQVGLITAYGPLMTWFDDITCQDTGVPNGPVQPAQMGEPQIGWFDAAHQPVDHPMPVADDVIIFDRSAEINAECQYDFNPEEWAGSSFEIASDGETAVSVPSQFALETAYPNPFNPSTSFAVTLPETAELTVSVYNVAGQLVTTLANGTYSAGKHAMTFDASNRASGLYFIRATVPGQFDQVQKVMLVR